MTNGQIGILTRRVAMEESDKKPVRKKRMTRTAALRPKRRFKVRPVEREVRTQGLMGVGLESGVVAGKLSPEPQIEAHAEPVGETARQVGKAEPAAEPKPKREQEYGPISAVNIGNMPMPVPVQQPEPAEEARLDTLDIEAAHSPLPQPAPLARLATAEGTVRPHVGLADFVKGERAPSKRPPMTSQQQVRRAPVVEPIPENGLADRKILTSGTRRCCATTHSKRKWLRHEESNSTVEGCVVHTYSLPKGLTAYKKQKIYSDSERDNADKYSKETVEAAVYTKVAGVHHDSSMGFKGHTLSTTELKRALGYFSKTLARKAAAGTSSLVALSSRASTSHVEPVKLSSTRFDDFPLPFDGKLSARDHSFVLQNTIIKERSMQHIKLLRELGRTVDGNSARHRKQNMSKQIYNSLKKGAARMNASGEEDDPEMMSKFANKKVCITVRIGVGGIPAVSGVQN